MHTCACVIPPPRQCPTATQKTQKKTLDHVKKSCTLFSIPRTVRGERKNDMTTQAIKTKYIGPRATKGSRIQASCEARTIYVHYDYALGNIGNHRAACEALLLAMGWTTDTSQHNSDMVGGWHGDACYWVFANSDGDNRTTINSASKQEAA
jgi:hypothetical protein